LGSIVRDDSVFLVYGKIYFSKRDRIMKVMKTYNAIRAVSAVLALILFTLIMNVKSYAQVVTTPEGIKFDSNYYAVTNPEIVEIYGDTLDGLYRHYLEHGKEEGRYPSLESKNGNGSTDGASNVTISINPDATRIYVGDSRTFGMHQVIGDDGASWISFPGTRFDAFLNSATPLIDDMSLSGKQIIILYGINDITTYGAKTTFDYYNNFLKTKGQEWIKKGAKVYFANLVGVNYDLCISSPGTPAYSVDHTNSEVNSFNSMMSSFPSNIKKVKINVSGNPFYDGIHYNIETCQSVYSQINGQL